MFDRVKIALAVIFLSLLVGSCSVPGPVFAGTGKAYVIIGDIEPTWYSTLLRSIFGQVDIRKDMDPVIQAQARKMQELGYDVEFIEIGLTSDIERIIKDPNTKALAWFGHGDPRIAGTIAAYDGDITPGDIARWAEEKLTEKIGRPESWKALSEEERRKNIELWQNPHFNLEYAYFHTCYSLANNNMPDVLMADNGKFYGYPEKAYLNDTSVLASKIRDKDISEESPENGTGSDIFPSEPFYGMQINYSVSGANISNHSDVQQSEAYVMLNSRSISGELESGQLLITGTASVLGRAKEVVKEDSFGLRFPGIDGNITASLNVQVVVYDSAGDYNVERYDKTIDISEARIFKQPFSVMVPIPPGAQSGNFTIYVTTYHADGERGVKVSGDFIAGASTSGDYQQGKPVGNSDAGQVNWPGDASGSADYPQNGEISVYMDGLPLIFDVPPVIEDDRTLVPIRKIVESMGGTVDWYEGGYIDIQKDGRNIYLSIDLPVALVDNEPVSLDVPPRIINNRTLVPLRFVAETFGLKVEWDESTSSVYLNNN